MCNNVCRGASHTHANNMHVWRSRSQLLPLLGWFDEDRLHKFMCNAIYFDSGRMHEYCRCVYTRTLVCMYSNVLMVCPKRTHRYTTSMLPRGQTPWLGCEHECVRVFVRWATYLAGWIRLNGLFGCALRIRTIFFSLYLSYLALA